MKTRTEQIHQIEHRCELTDKELEAIMLEHARKELDLRPEDCIRQRAFTSTRDRTGSSGVETYGKIEIDAKPMDKRLAKVPSRKVVELDVEWLMGQIADATGRRAYTDGAIIGLQDLAKLQAFIDGLNAVLEYHVPPEFPTEDEGPF